MCGVVTGSANCKGVCEAPYKDVSLFASQTIMTVYGPKEKPVAIHFSYYKPDCFENAREKASEGDVERLKSRVRVLQWTLGAVAMLGGGVVAYYHVPVFAEFVNNVPSSVKELFHTAGGFIENSSSALGKLVNDFVEESKGVLEDIKQKGLKETGREVVSYLRGLTHKL